MDWHFTSATILVIGATIVALLALGNRILLVRAAQSSQRRIGEMGDELAKVRRAADDRQQHDGETISRLQNRIQQQGQLLRALQEDLDKFILQHRTMLEIKSQPAGAASPSAQQETAAVEQREKAIREKLKSMLQEFRAVTGGEEADESKKAA